MLPKQVQRKSLDHRPQTITPANDCKELESVKGKEVEKGQGIFRGKEGNHTKSDPFGGLSSLHIAQHT